MSKTRAAWRGEGTRETPAAPRARSAILAYAMSGDGPKTAYELAMERLRQKDRESAVQEQRPLTDAQKASLAEARKIYQAKVAEREILHQDALVKAKSHEEIEKLNEEMRRDLERLATDRDRRIDEIRKRG